MQGESAQKKAMEFIVCCELRRPAKNPPLANGSGELRPDRPPTIKRAHSGCASPRPALSLAAERRLLRQRGGMPNFPWEASDRPDNIYSHDPIFSFLFHCMIATTSERNPTEPL
ncbi:hypothetical protein LIA77_07400 [Sarocladium implicatum]|nr:hypothetical protein LIA77_07400 [Sarocladium implicatum]